MTASRSVPRELAPGQILAGRFRLERLVGQGGGGAVWQATNTLTSGSVALKLLTNDGGDGTRKRLLREARAAAAVQHPNVRGVLDVIEIEDGSPVLVMEYLDGETLAERLRVDKKLSVEDSATLAVQIACGVGAAHAAGLVHRDLKPQNVFLVGGSLAHVKVLDFGVAKWGPEAEDGSLTAQTESGAVVGTPYYMSPEQVFGERDINQRSDIWALGLLMYECLSGVLPTRAENVGQVMKLIVSRPIPALSSREPSLPAELTQLVARMLSRDPQERPTDVHEVLDVIEQLTPFRAQRVATALPARRLGSPRVADSQIDATEAGQTTLVSGEVPALTRPRRGRGLAAVGALSLGLGVIVWQVAAPPARQVQPGAATSLTASVKSALPSSEARASAASTSSALAEAAPSFAASPVSSSAAVQPSTRASVRVREGQPARSASAAAAGVSSASPSAFSPSKRFE